MNDLAAWLLERIAEDEEVARAATPGPWEPASVYYGPNPDSGIAEVAAPSGDVVSHQKYEGGGASVADAAHIARWDPARVLAECAAKRRIIELAAHEPGRKTTFRREMILQALAQPYADRPGWREEWAT